MKCILIDDDRDDIDIFQFAIDELKLDIEFIGFTKFEEAFNELINNELRPDYIFLDGSINTVTGKEGLQRIKANEKVSNIPVIIYSGFISDEARSELLSLGAADAVMKLNTVQALLDYLKSLFSSVSKP